MSGGWASPVLITQTTLVDGTGAPPITDAAILVRDGRIVAAGPSAAVRTHPAAEQAERLDASGTWTIPGLIDSHIHSALTGFESMPVFLACGVTTVRDVGGPLDVVTSIRDRLAAGDAPGPRFVFCGPLIDGEPASFPSALLPIIQATPDAAAAASLADECIKQGAGAIKLYFRLPRASLQAAIHRVAGRVPVTGHLGLTRASEAVEDGINCFEHVVVTIYNDVVREEDRFDALKDSMADPNFWIRLHEGWARADLNGVSAQSLLDAMRRADVTLDPTLDITALVGARAAVEDPNVRYVRPELRELWEMRRQAAGPRPQGDPETGRAGHVACGDFVRRYHEIGGRVIAGTDVGAVPYLVPGFSLHGELQELVSAGLSNEAALRAATIEAARALRVDPETGSIAPGKCADLVILERNPLEDIANVASIREVMHEGKRYRPADLLAAS
jgi:imidazolonepropionase-like amidohydrolase